MAFVCQDRAEALAKIGHEVFVITTGAACSREQGMLSIIGAGCPECRYSDEFATRCSELVRQIDPAIVHLESFDSARPWWVDCGKPVTITLHGFGFGAFLSHWNLWHVNKFMPLQCGREQMLKERDLLAKADRVIAISPSELWQLQDPYALSNAVLVRNPISNDFFDRPLADPPVRRSFVCAAVSHAAQRRFREVKRIGRDIEVAVTMADSYERSQMPELYDRHSALVLPSLYAQGSSLTTDEALSRGRPVIAWNTGSIWHDQRPGIVKVAPGDLDGLAAAMTGHLPTVDAVTSHGVPTPPNHPAVHADNWLKAVAID